MSKHSVTCYSLCALLLLVLSASLADCGTTAASTPPKPTATPTPTLTVYTGSGYSIGYPKGWTLNHSNTQQVQISDSAQDNMGIQTSPSQSNSVSPQLAQSVMQSVLALLKQGEKDYKEASVPSKTTIGGTTWDQKAATMTDPKLGPIQFIILYTQSLKHPGQIFIIFYGTSLKTFNKINNEDFQPMLKSFKFQA